jgi:hypothetical protein
MPSSPPRRGFHDSDIRHRCQVPRDRCAACPSEVRYRDLPGRQDAADHRHRARAARHRAGEPRTLWPLQGQGLHGFHQIAEEPTRRQAHPRLGDHADPGRRGQDHHHGRAHRRAQPYRQESDALPARAESRAVVRHERRCRRRRLRAGGADGRHQSTLYRRLSRDRHCTQPAFGADSTSRSPRR